jgi:hypothetical protein
MQVRDFKTEARERHQPLREAAEALKQAAAGKPAEMTDALEQVSAALAAHIALTEGPEGTHDDLLAVAPRLANDIRLLTKDHDFMERLVDTIGVVLRSETPDWQVIDEHVNRLLDHIAGHRLRDAELVYEAYHVDIGGQA